MKRLVSTGIALMFICIAGHWIATMLGSNEGAWGALFGVTAIGGFLVGVVCAVHKSTT